MGDFEKRYGITDTQLSQADGDTRGKIIFGNRSKIILGLLLDHQKDGLTAREIHNYLLINVSDNIEIHSTRPLLTKLGPDTRRGIGMHLIETIGRRLDEKTGQKISVWCVATDKVSYVEKLLN